jgi:hypothetical protein
MRPLVIIVIALGISLLVGIIWFTNWYRAAASQDARMTASFVPNPANDTLVSGSGWDQSELDRILGDFSQQYGLPANSFKIERGDSRKFRISFPHDIEPKLLLFLVNYLEYPNGFDLKSHSIAAVAHVVLTAAFGVSDPTLIGNRARIYVPSNDVDHDLVYAQVQRGRSFRISFTDMIWQEVDDARLPLSIRSL